MAYEDLMKLLQGQQKETEESPMIPFRPEDQMEPVQAPQPQVMEEAVDMSETAQINEEAKSPNMMTKPELVKKEVSEEVEKTPVGQMKDIKEGSEVSAEESMLRRIRQYEEEMNKPTKSNWKDNLPDMLAGLHNIINYSQGSQQKNIPLNFARNKQSQDLKAKQQKLGQIQQLQKMYQDYMNTQTKGQLTPFQKAQLESADKDRALKEKQISAKSGRVLSEFDKAKEKAQAKEFVESQQGLQKTATAMSKIDDALEAQLDYSKNTMAGTGPIATGFGLKKYLDSDTEALEAKFKDIDLKNMVSTFSGMSKAVDSDAERKAWKATQASTSNDDMTNVQILLGSKSSLMKDKVVAEAKAEHVKEFGNLDNFKHPVLEGKVTTMVNPQGEMVLVDKNKVKELEKQGMKSLDDHAKTLLSGETEGPEFVTMIAPNGQEASVRKDMVQKYLDKGAKIKE